MRIGVSRGLSVQERRREEYIIPFPREEKEGERKESSPREEEVPAYSHAERKNASKFSRASRFKRRRRGHKKLLSRRKR